MCRREVGSARYRVRSRAAGGWGSGDGRGWRPMLWWHVGVVRPRRAISSDRSGRIRVRRVRSRCLGVCSWSVSVGVRSRLTWIVVGHGAQLETPRAFRSVFSFLARHTPPPMIMASDDYAACWDKKVNPGRKMLVGIYSIKRGGRVANIFQIRQCPTNV